MYTIKTINKLISKKSLISLLALGCSLAIFLSACEDDSDSNDPSIVEDELNYVIEVYPQDGGDLVIHGVPDLKEGTYVIGDALETDEEVLQMTNGRIYGGITEYNFQESSGYMELRDLANQEIIDWYFGYTFDIGEDEIAILSTSYEYYRDETDVLNYFIADVENFSVTESASVPIDFLPAGSIIYPTGIKAYDDKLALTYLVYDSDWATTDTSYAAIVDRSTLTYLNTTKDTRTTSIGIPYRYNQDHALVDGDLYVASSNTNWWGIGEHLPGGILRIKSGETEWDPDYFLNITEITGGNFQVFMQPVGNGKALTIVHNKSLMEQTDEGYSGFNSTFSIEHWELDLAAGTAVKLDIPPSMGTNLSVTSVGSDEYAIAANTEDGNFFYIYNSGTGAVTQGAQYVGGSIGNVTILD